MVESLEEGETGRSMSLGNGSLAKAFDFRVPKPSFTRAFNGTWTKGGILDSDGDLLKVLNVLIGLVLMADDSGDDVVERSTSLDFVLGKDMAQNWYRGRGWHASKGVCLSWLSSGKGTWKFGTVSRIML